MTGCKCRPVRKSANLVFIKNVLVIVNTGIGSRSMISSIMQLVLSILGKGELKSNQQRQTSSVKSV